MKCFYQKEHSFHEVVIIRTFLAIDFNSALKSKISQLQVQLRHDSSGGRWKYPDNFHLTIKFLDDIDESKALEVDQVMSGVCRGRESFELEISHVGYFPSYSNTNIRQSGNNVSAGNDIRVLWLGISGDMEKLLKLQAETETALKGLGFETERRPFSPHVTIAQDICMRKPMEELNRTIAFEPFDKISVDRLYLFKSEQYKGKRLYTPISEYRFSL